MTSTDATHDNNFKWFIFMPTLSKSHGAKGWSIEMLLVRVEIEQMKHL